MKKDKKKISRKERERQMIAEMDAAMWGNKIPDGDKEESIETPAEESAKANRQKTPQKEKSGQREYHCPRCKTLMENGKCPTCGHYIYVPMDREKHKKIRWIVGGVCIIAFAILFVLSQVKN